MNRRKDTECRDFVDATESVENNTLKLRIKVCPHCGGKDFVFGKAMYHCSCGEAFYEPAEKIKYVDVNDIEKVIISPTK